MLKRTITKKFIFVIYLLIFCFSVNSCNFVFSSEQVKDSNKRKEYSDDFGEPKILGKIDSKKIEESSGLAASRCNKDIFWTHNDSGNSNYIFALNKKAELVGTWQVLDAKNTDWEDIAAVKDKSGKCFLYIGDIGNNSRIRGDMNVFRVREPKVGPKTTKIRSTEKAETIEFTYADMRHDAETLLVHPETFDIYVLTKRLSGAAGVYKIEAGKTGKKQTVEKIANVSVPALPNGFLTGGDISFDGSRVVICDYFNAYELVLPKNAENFDNIWVDEPSVIKLGKREQGEAVCYSVDGEAVYATSENENSPLIEVKRISQ